MLLSAIVNPDTFAEKNFDPAGHYSDNILLFLRGIHTNGVIVGDAHGTLTRKMREQYDLSPSSKRDPEIKVRFEELFNPNAQFKRVMDCINCPGPTVEISTEELIQIADTASKADAVLGPTELQHYVRCRFEKRRDDYSQFKGSLHQVLDERIEDIIVRSVRFSNWLRFNESQLATKPKPNETFEAKCARFYEGFSYILDLWAGHGVRFRHGPSEVAIITAVSRYTSLEEIRRFENEIREFVCDPLQKKFKVPVNLSLKRDEHGVVHYRCLQTESVVLAFDRGFDLFCKGKKRRFKANNVNLGDIKRCREYQDLPSAYTRW